MELRLVLNTDTPYIPLFSTVSGWYGFELKMNDGQGNVEFEQKLDVFIRLADVNESPSLEFMNVDRTLCEHAVLALRRGISIHKNH